MTLDELIALAEQRTPAISDVEATARTLGIPVQQVLDDFARTVATRFCRGVYPYADADAAMNGLFGLLVEMNLPDFVWAVYGAFDEGEYIPEPPDGPQGEDLTRALLRKVLGGEC